LLPRLVVGDEPDGPALGIELPAFGKNRHKNKKNNQKDNKIVKMIIFAAWTYYKTVACATPLS
jgi:hypothetical protein